MLTVSANERQRYYRRAVSADDHYQHWYMYPYRVIDNCPSKTVSGMWHKITPFRINGNLEQKLAVKTAFIGPNFSLFPKILKIRQSHYQPEWCANFQGNPNLAK